MTLSEMKEQVMFQTNNDADDLEDFEPHINDYINDGYDRLIFVWAHQHINTPGFPALQENTDIPNVPDWTHRYLTDWATWLVYRNGNPQKQQRGYAFRESFLLMLSMISDQGGIDGMNEDGTSKKYNKIKNIPW